MTKFTKKETLTLRDAFDYDIEGASDALKCIRMGHMPLVIDDGAGGWELNVSDHTRYFPLKTSQCAVNMILHALAAHYSGMSAVLGDPAGNREV